MTEGQSAGVYPANQCRLQTEYVTTLVCSYSVVRVQKKRANIIKILSERRLK